MKRVLLLAVLIVAISGIAAGAYVFGKKHERDRVTKEQQAYPLLAKRVFIDNPNDVIINFEPLRSRLMKELGYYGEDNISLYFEYLPTGTSIRYGASTQLVGASLLKLPSVMDLYFLAGEGKIDLEKKVSIKEEWLDDQYGNLYKKGAGHTLTIRELARITLEESDNTALNAIQELVAEQNMPATDSSFNRLDIEYTDTDNTDLVLSARAYSSFLKCLYFACYIPAEESHILLTHLVESSAGRDRIVKYLPEGVEVAHKIGVAGDATQGDCGIVYVPNRSYIFCMLINESNNRGSEVIAQMSKFVYDYVTEAK